MLRNFGGHSPHLAADAYVDPSAEIIGQVRIGARSSIWCNVTLRADTAAIEVGEDSSVQDNSCLHEDADAPLAIGDRVVVGHSCTVHGCIVEDECLIGMGSTILSKARIGAGSIVAAGAVVLGGQQIPPRSLVAGIPAAVKRSVSEDEVARTRLNAQHYVELSRQYLEEAHPEEE